MKTLTQKVEIDAPAKFAFEWHERPGAFDRLAPPWETMRTVRSQGGIRNGGELVFEVRLGPGLWQKWHARHYDYDPPNSFSDEQVEGPFAQWKHVHRFAPAGAGKCSITDHVEYELPLAPVSRIAERFFVRQKLNGMFAYRSTRAKNDIERHYRAQLTPMRVAISGASGMVGREIASLLIGGGHTVIPLVRSRQKQSEQNGIYWSAKNGLPNESLKQLDGIDAVIHLAGEPVAGVWTESKKRKIHDSRVNGTRLLSEALAKLPRPPRVFISASATGYYGDRGDDALKESSAPGDGFLASTCVEWEAATAPAREAGIRTVLLRTGLVLSPRGGALKEMLRVFRLGLGGRLGSGDQYFSWISIDDHAGLIHHALANGAVEGAMNATAPNPVSNREFTKVLARVLNRPVGPPVPSFLLKMAPGEMAEEALLASAKVIPTKALDTGYEFAFPQVEDALRHLLGKPKYLQ